MSRARPHPVPAVLLAATLALAAACGCTRHRPPGVLAADEPVQEPETDGRAFEVCGFTLTPLARFRITARVLHTCDYRMDREARLSPRDLALGWGPMSDSAVLADFRVDQMARFFSWHADELPIPRDEVVSHSANMHIIPADGAVRRALDRLEPGDVVTIDGDLVEAEAPDGWRWVSSMSRDDTGDGACELVYARTLKAR